MAVKTPKPVIAGLICLSVLWAATHVRPAPDAPAVLNLSLVDASTNEQVPARVEVLDKDGRSFVADDALLIGGDCIDRDDPWEGTLEQALRELTPRLTNLHTGTDQFCTAGACRLSLPPGDYRIRVFRGLEYRVATRELVARAGQTHDVVVPLQRWSNMAGKGWYSADSHLHIARGVKELNRPISRF